MDSVYIRASHDSKTNYFNINLESLITTFVYKLCNSQNIILHIVLQKCISKEPLFSTNFSDLNYLIILDESVPTIAKYCTWPVIVVDKTVTAGLAAVCRQIIKSSNNDKRNLLGFREACLLACNEVSVWTKFCEIDMVSTVKRLTNNPQDLVEDQSIVLPKDLTRFENHMEQPVKMHNVYKLARLKNNNKTIKSSVPVCKLNLDHLYGEGLYMTLADILLFPCFQIIFRIFGNDILGTVVPLTSCWFNNMMNQEIIPKFEFSVHHENTIDSEFSKILNSENQLHLDGVNPKIKISKIIQENIPKQSLYTCDPARYKPQTRIYTRQNEIEGTVNFIKTSKLVINSPQNSYCHDMELNWNKIPMEATPSSGALPKKRAARKTQQLENMVKAVLKVVAGKSLVIVDFCCGSGHLGILVATLLPNCKIVLVENKEKSLQRAKVRVETLGLKNITFLQCNLDYFQTSFDIGLSLHACGVATDLVIEACIKSKADFICCPCCYGGIHNCHHLSYPRSSKFREVGVQYKDFLVISHAADQTHDEDNVKTSQGYLCMNIVDNDRKFYAEECGYYVYLEKLQPPSCTPKNNLLIGIFKKRLM